MIQFAVHVKAPQCIVGAVLIGSITAIAAADDLPLAVADLGRTDAVDFGKEIMPILKRNCLACHHRQEAEGGLMLETIEEIRAGGDSGHGVVAKDVAASLVFVRATGTEEPLMPPEDNSVGAKPLTPQELGLLKLWIEQGASGSDVSTSRSIDWQPIPESVRTVYAIDVAPDGQWAAIGRGNRVVVVDLHNHTEVARLVDPSLSGSGVADVDLIQSIAFSPDAQRIATGGYRTVRIWRKSLPRVDLSDSPLQAAAGLIAVKSDASAAAMVNAIGDIEIWDLNDNRHLHTLTGHADAVAGLAWAADRIFACDPSGKLSVWQASTGTMLAEILADAALTQLSSSPNGDHVAAIDIERKVHLFQLGKDGQSIERIAQAAGDLSDATAVAFADKPAPMAIIATESGSVVMLNLADHNVIRKLDHGAAVDALAVTGDQARLVTGGRDGKTRIWNIADAKPVLTLQGDPQLRLQLASANRDAARQKASVARLNQTTGQLEKLLAKEDEVLKKATEAKQQATKSLAAEETKYADAVALVSATEVTLAAANSDSAKAAQVIEAAKKTIAAAQSTSAAAAKELEVKKAELGAAQAAAAKAQQQLDEIQKQLSQAKARVEKIQSEINKKNTAIEQAKGQAANAQQQIDTATKMAARAKAVTEKANKDLETQKKGVTAAEEAKRKSAAEVAKRQQALDTATSAHRRASDAIPAHKAIIEWETRLEKLLTARLADAQARISPPGNGVTDVTVSRDDARVAVAHRDGSIRLFRAADGQPISALATSHRGGRLRLALIGDSICRFAISTRPSCWSQRVQWILERTIGSIDDESVISDRATALDFRHDGMSLAVGSGPPSRSGEVKVFDVDSGRLIRDFGQVHSDTVLAVRFSPRGRLVASSAADKTIRLIDVASGHVSRSLEGHTHHVLSIAWQDDGQTIASASADRSVKIWNTETGQQRRTISGFSKEITAVDFVQTSNQIVAACADGQLRLHDTSNGKAIRSFNASGDFLFTLSVTPDGKKLLAGGQNGTVRIWTLADGKLVHELK